jgi:hypothetical protein
MPEAHSRLSLLTNCPSMFTPSLAFAHILTVALFGAGPACPADLDLNGAVDGSDMGLLLAAWGSPNSEAADLDGNGMVDAADLGLLLAAWGVCRSSTCPENDWLPGFTKPGTGGDVHATITHDDGTGLALYVAGSFGTAGGLSVPSNIARWHGETWSAVPGDLSSSVRALEVHDEGSGEALFAAGTFSSIDGVPFGRIARWDGVAWSPLAGGLGSTVWALESFDDGSGPALYAGGAFTTANGAPANRIAKWDGTVWSPLGAGLNGTVRTLQVHDDGSGPALYVGGEFTTAGGAPANRIARWDGAEWSALGSGASDHVWSLASVGDEMPAAAGLVVGGTFTSVDGVSAARIARWTGREWTALGSTLNGTVQSLAVYDDGNGAQLYAGGTFLGTFNRLARWDGATWNQLPELPFNGGFSGFVTGLLVHDDGLGGGPALFPSGEFTAIKGLRGNHIARFDSTGWSGLGKGVTGDTTLSEFIFDATYFDDGRGDGPVLFVTGLFTHAGGIPASNIARWDGNRWEALGSGLSDRGYALEVYDDGSGPALYVGGEFTLAGGQQAKRVAKWDGKNWSPLGAGVEGGIDSAVYALRVFDVGFGPELFAGGSFTMAGGLQSSGTARWNGTTWTADSIGGGVVSLEVLDDVVTGDPRLYAGGSGAFGVRDGTGWTLPLVGLSGTVWAFERFDDGSGPKLVIAGTFPKVGNLTVNRIAQWDGVQWSALGAGITGTTESAVYDLSVFDDGDGPRLHVGGHFRFAGGQTATNLAAWDGGAWHTIGAGVGTPLDSNHRIYRFASHPLDPSSLAVGGIFTTADGLPSYNIAFRGCAE